MAVPVLDIRTNHLVTINDINRIANDGFETDTSGWSVSAGIQGAGTSITRNTSGGAWEGTARGRLVTTSTSGSGVKYVISGTFSEDVTYRFRVYLKSVSGATTCGIRLGSLGTAGDRATSTFTVTATWTAYSVDLTPSGDRSDIQVNVYTTSSSAMTVDIDAAEVYRVGDDLTAYAESVNWSYGLDFQGGLVAGSCTVRLKNDDFRFSNDLVAAAEIVIGNPLYIRATYGGVPYGLFYGTVRRMDLVMEGKMLEVVASDPVDAWGRTAEVNVAASYTRSIAEFRGAILDALGEPAARRDLSTGEHEADTPFTGSDARAVLGLIAALDSSVGTLSYVVPHPSTSVLYRYTTLPRNERIGQAAAETIADENWTGLGLGWNDDETILAQRVTVTNRTLAGSQTVWTAPDLPITVASGETRTVWASLTDPVFSSSLVSSATNSPTINYTPFYRSAKIEIIGPGSGTTVSELSITGQSAVAGDGQSVLVENVGANNPWVGSPIDAEFASSTANAYGLADFITYESGQVLVHPRGTVTVEQRFPTQVARTLGQVLDATITAVDFGTTILIRSIDTTVDMAATRWITTYGVFPVSGSTFFTLDSSALGGAKLLGH